jgi:hypothetical protein
VLRFSIESACPAEKVAEYGGSGASTGISPTPADATHIFGSKPTFEAI